MKLIRTFHPVGQGAFYTEDFENFKIVYDCGSSTKSKKKSLLIKKIIESTFIKKQVIDAVFISHLHEDHVNGLKSLLKHCIVRKLFLPFITLSEKIDIYVQNYIFGYQSQFIERLIFNSNSISEEFNLEIVFVPLADNESAINIEIEPSLIEAVKSDDLKQNPRIKTSKVPDWVFIPFNFRHSQRSTDLLNALKNLKNKENISIEDIADFEKHWKNNEDRKKIIDAYKSVPGSLNTNSMTLYSGPDKVNYTDFYLNMISRFNLNSTCCFNLGLVGCIYFGDYDASGSLKFKQLENKYSTYWGNVGTVQVPHHGSIHNYNKDINDFPKYSIISAGSTNQYHHPHALTVKHILTYGGIPLIVNEFPGTFVMFEIIAYPLSYIRCLKIRKIMRKSYSRSDPKA